MGLCVWRLAQWLIPAGGTGRPALLIDVAICMIIGMTVFIGLALVLRVPELDALKQIMVKRTQPT